MKFHQLHCLIKLLNPSFIFVFTANDAIITAVVSYLVFLTGLHTFTLASFQLVFHTFMISLSCKTDHFLLKKFFNNSSLLRGWFQYTSSGFNLHVCTELHRYPQSPVLSWSLSTHDFIYLKVLLVVLQCIKNVLKFLDTPPIKRWCSFFFCCIWAGI